MHSLKQPHSFYRLQRCFFGESRIGWIERRNSMGSRLRHSLTSMSFNMYYVAARYPLDFLPPLLLLNDPSYLLHQLLMMVDAYFEYFHCISWRIWFVFLHYHWLGLKSRPSCMIHKKVCINSSTSSVTYMWRFHFLARGICRKDIFLQERSWSQTCPNFNSATLHRHTFSHHRRQLQQYHNSLT